MKKNENSLEVLRGISEGYRCVGAVERPQRPSEGSEKSCGERESGKKSLNLGN